MAIPCWGAGELRVPVATAEILTFMSPQAMSFKMSMPLSEAGALLQDRPSCIVADTRERAPGAADRHQRVHPERRPRSGWRWPARPARRANAPKADADKTFHVEVGMHRALTPILVSSVTNNAIQTVVPDVAESVIEIQSRIQARGFPVLEQSDFLYASEGARNKLINTSTGCGSCKSCSITPLRRCRSSASSFDWGELPRRPGRDRQRVAARR